VRGRCWLRTRLAGCRARGFLSSVEAPRGQVLIIAAAFIAFALIPIMLAAWGIAQQRADYVGIQGLVRQSAQDAAGAVTSASMMAGAPAYDQGEADRLIKRTLGEGLRRYAPRVDPAYVLSHDVAPATMLYPTPPVGGSVTDPATGAVYHHPTVCVTVTAKIGVIEYDGLAFTYTFHSCNASVANG